MEPHKLALDYPPIEDLAEFDEDIRAKGLLNPAIYTYEGKILDGWHRYQAAVKAGKQPKLIAYTGDDPEGFIDSLNGMRRHLRKEQIAVIMALRAKRQGRLSIPIQGQSHQVAERPDAIGTTEIASSAKVGETTAKQAVRLADERPARAKAVAEGKASLKKEYAKLPGHKRAPSKKAPPKSFAATAEVKWLLEYTKAWKSVLHKEALPALAQGKFSPEAAAFFARRLREVFEPTAKEFETWAAKHGQRKQ